jgi:glycosyltransferase involved in cell wall biosynthesis
VPALLAARLVGIKKRVIRKQDTAYHWNFKPLWVWADRFNNFNATDIIAISEDSKKFLLENEKAPARKVHMIHNGIPINDFTAQLQPDKEFLIKKYGLEGKLVLGTISRYIEWKGYRYIIEAARTLTLKYKNLKFLFCWIW